MKKTGLIYSIRFINFSPPVLYYNLSFVFQALTRTKSTTMFMFVSNLLHLCRWISICSSYVVFS